MPFCDICSIVITKSEMRIKPASAIMQATSRGYVPKSFAEHSLYVWQIGDSKIPRPILWQMVVGSNGAGEWGLCGSCNHEFMTESGVAQEEERAVNVVGCLVGLALAAIVAGLAYAFPESFLTWVKGVDWWSVVCYIAAGICLLFAGACLVLLWIVARPDEGLAYSLLGLFPGALIFAGLFPALGSFQWWYLLAFVVGIAGAAIATGPWSRPARVRRAKMERIEIDVLGRYCARRDMEQSWDAVIALAKELADEGYLDRVVSVVTAGWESALYRDDAEGRKACEQALRCLGIDPNSIKTTARRRREEHKLLQMLLKGGSPFTLAAITRDDDSDNDSDDSDNADDGPANSTDQTDTRQDDAKRETGEGQHETHDAGQDADDGEILATLVELCQAYTVADRAAISRLEPLATRIGERLNERGGINEMRRIFRLVPDMRGKRTLDMHWGGIGDWLG